MTDIVELPHRTDVRVEQYPKCVELDRDGDDIVRVQLEYAVVLRIREIDTGRVIGEPRECGSTTFEAWPLRDRLVHRILTAGPCSSRFAPEGPLPITLNEGLLAKALERGVTPAAIWTFAMHHGGAATWGVMREPAQAADRNGYQDKYQNVLTLLKQLREQLSGYRSTALSGYRSMALPCLSRPLCGWAE
ncbi:MAG: hypothetical protein JO166_07870 [Deltaproteobacteria bacterium]|nr:hypothetical protein [Deltaproteobacteria bacterium]